MDFGSLAKIPDSQLNKKSLYTLLYASTGFMDFWSLAKMRDGQLNKKSFYTLLYASTGFMDFWSLTKIRDSQLNKKSCAWNVKKNAKYLENKNHANQPTFIFLALIDEEFHFTIIVNFFFSFISFIFIPHSFLKYRPLVL